MKTITVVFLAFSISSSASQADQLPASLGVGVEGARFSAMSVTKDQGVRVIVSNVLVPANDIRPAPCQVQVSFFGPDGSPIGSAAMVQLKAGESASVVASQPSKLVRSVVSIGNVADPAKVCALRTNVEIFDVQTGTTFVSVPGESISGSTECSVSPASALLLARRNLFGRKNSAPVATSSSPSGGTVSPKTRSPILAATPLTGPR
jgi:hypothetical protein